MSDNSRSQFRDARRINNKVPLRWAGQFMALVTTDDGARLLVGVWWDEREAWQWAGRLPDERRGWNAEVFELQFKDFWVPFRRHEEVIPLDESAAYL